jgi:hypothetical protein
LNQQSLPRCADARGKARLDELLHRCELREASVPISNLTMAAQALLTFAFIAC